MKQGHQGEEETFDMLQRGHKSFEKPSILYILLFFTIDIYI